MTVRWTPGRGCILFIISVMIGIGSAVVWSYRAGVQHLITVVDLNAFGPYAPVMGLLDQISPYSKAGRMEIYGAALQQTRSGPIIVRDSVLWVAQQRAALVWWPQCTSAAGATHLRVKLSAVSVSGAVRILFKFTDGYVYAFVVPLGGELSRAASTPATTDIPKDLSEWLDKPMGETKLTRVSDGVWLAKLPGSVTKRIRDLGPSAISEWAIQIEHAAGNSVHFDEVALVKSMPLKVATAHLKGKIIGYPQPPGATVSLMTDTGQTRTALVSDSNTFTFLDVPVGRPVSIWYRLDEQNYFAEQGHWFVPQFDRDDINIDLKVLYFNADGHPANPKSAIWNGTAPSDVGALYVPHARVYWPGAGAPQAFDSHTFTNNWGYVDRDRFFDNPADCLRIVELGPSQSVALQLPIADKYNMLLEDDLGVRLGRCVEVISAGRDNGDIGSNYRRIRDYAIRFKPEIILLSISRSTIMQLQPSLLKSGFGWDHEHSPLDHFDYDDGKLSFHLWDPNYALHVSEPDFKSPVPGVAFFDILNLPWNDLPKEGREALKYMGDIVTYFHMHHPGIRFVPYTALDQMQCIGACRDYHLKSSDGSNVLAMEMLRQNIDRTCQEYGLECLDLPIPPADTVDPSKRLVFYNDGHYNIRGHQWLAHQLSILLAAKIEGGGSPE